MRIEQLMDSLPKSYTPADRELVQRAYRVAERAHTGHDVRRLQDVMLRRMLIANRPFSGVRFQLNSRGEFPR